ncbi:MAG: hypothetical protein AAF465_05970 [Pseudomonadota bacterium]
MKKSFCLLAILLTACAFAQQGPQTVNVPISRPGEPIELDINIMSARIEVIGENRDDAQFEVMVADGQRKIVTPSGTQLLKGGAYALEIEEDNNAISFDADWRSNRVTVLARIPRRANLSLRTINNGEIIVSNVEGSLKLSNVNGPITATNISGSVIAESVNKDITVSFARLDGDSATSFETINGDLRLGLPPDAGAKLYLDTSNGEVYSDFDVDVEPSKPVVKRKDDARGAAIRIESVIIANVNGGGPVVRMKGLQGDIYIEKNQ